MSVSAVISTTTGSSSDNSAIISLETKSASTTSSSSSSSSSSDLAKLRTYASDGMSVSEIAQKLGKSVSDVVLEAANAGISLNSGSSTTTTNSSVGNNVNTTA